MSKADRIAFLIVIGVLTIIAMFCTSAAVMLPPPANGAPVLLTLVSGIAIGMYITTFVLLSKR